MLVSCKNKYAGDYLPLLESVNRRLMCVGLQQVDTSVLGLSPEEAKKMPYIASMGIYVFRKDILLKLLR